MEKELRFEELRFGMRVKNSAGEIGTILQILEPCNIHVLFSSGWISVYCLDKTKKEYDPLFNV